MAAPNIFAPLRGKVTLAVNVASKCGYTPQYAGLEELYRRAQGPEFHGGRFSLQSVRRARARHRGGDSNVLFAELWRDLSAVGKNRGQRPAPPSVVCLADAPENGFPGDIGWNFEKFLIDRGGRVACRYPAGTKPTDPRFLQDLANSLARRLRGILMHRLEPACA